MTFKHDHLWTQPVDATLPAEYETAFDRRPATAGMFNADFGDLPPFPTDNINDTTNPLPYWSFVQDSGTTVTVQSSVQSAAGSGYEMSWSMTAGAAGDSAYLEQIVPVFASRTRSFVYRVWASFFPVGAGDASKASLEGQYLKSDGTMTGAVSISTAATSALAAGGTDLYATPDAVAAPSDAYSLRVRVGYQRGTLAAGTAGLGVLLGEVRIYVHANQLMLPDTADPATWGWGHLGQTNGVLTLSQQAGVAVKSILVGNADGTRQILGGVKVKTGDLQYDQRFNATSVSVLSPAQIVANTDDYNPATLATHGILRINSDAARNITGIVAGTAGDMLLLINIGAFTITLVHDATSTAANRFFCPGSASVLLRANGFVWIYYDGLSRKSVV